MPRKSPFAFAALVLVASSCSDATAPTCTPNLTPNIRVAITDAGSGTGLAQGSSVTFRTAGDSVAGQVGTDPRVALVYAPSGSGTLAVSHAGYVTWTQPVKVEAASAYQCAAPAVEVDARLEPAP